ncbi:cytochrome P450 [Trichoderma velutinum]
MLPFYTLLTTAVYGAVVAYVLQSISESISYRRKTKARGCGELKTYPHWDPIWGLDFVVSMSSAFKEHRFLSWMQVTWAKMGRKTFRARFLGMRMVYSSEMENMKAMSTSQWEEFVVEPIRMGNGVAGPVTGRGVSTSDGDFWHYSRGMTKPYFERQGFANTERLKPFTDKLLDLIPTDGAACDMQELIRRWFLDTSTEFLFGKTRDSLTHPERTDVVSAMIDIMRGARVRLLMGRFIFLHHDPQWHQSIKIVHNFMNEYIQQAYKELAEQKERLGDSADSADDSGRTDLLWDMVQKIEDPLLMRDQIMAVWFPSNETTSVYISNTIFQLSRHPKVWQRLQEEVQALGDEPLTFTRLRNMQYMNWILNEVHRTLPSGIQMVRQAACDTTLPRGGGQDGSKPIFCAKGDIVHCNRYLMHRDPDYWGADADQFRPERWGDARPLWHFVPFGGGPRICPAHILVATETAYVLTRFCQRFKTIESRDDRPYVPVMRAGPSNLHGVQIAVTPW